MHLLVRQTLTLPTAITIASLPSFPILDARPYSARLPGGPSWSEAIFNREAARAVALGLGQSTDLDKTLADGAGRGLLVAVGCRGVVSQDSTMIGKEVETYARQQQRPWRRC